MNARRYILIAFILLNIFLMILFGWNPTRAKVSKGNQAFANGNYEESAQKYEEALAKNPDSDIVNYDLGTANYKKGDYGKSEEHLQKVLLSDDPALKQKAHYNLGNTLFQKGMAQKDKDLQGAIGELGKAVEQYDGAISLNDKDEDAKQNQMIAKKKIEELKKLLEKQKQEQKQDGQSNQNQQGASSETQDNSQNSQENTKKGSQGQSLLDEKDQGEQSKSGEENKGQEKIFAQNENSSGTDYNTQQNQEAAGAQESEDQKDADRQIRSYQEEEEPKGLPNFMRASGGEKPVQKDW